MSTNETTVHEIDYYQADVVRFDWTDYDRPSIAVVEAVADALDRGQSSLDLLHNHVDGDALDALLTADTRAECEVSFAYDDVYVTVASSGRIEVWTAG